MNNEVTEEELILARKAYYKEYRQKNKNKMENSQKKFFTKKVLEEREKCKTKGIEQNEINSTTN